MKTRIFRQVALLIFLLSPFLSPGKEGSTEHIDSLNNVSFRLRSKDRATSVQAARQALALSEAIGYEKGTVNAKLNLVIFHTNSTHYDSALNLLRDIRSRLAGTQQQLVAEFFLGRIYSALRDYKLAKSHFEMADRIIQSHLVEVSQNPDLKDYIAAVPNSLGIMGYQQGLHNEALDYFSKAMEIQIKNGAPHNRELNNIALVYGKMNKFDVALRFMKESLRVVISLKDTLAMITTLTNVGIAYKQSSKFDSALMFYDSAYRFAIEKGISQQVADILVNKAILMQEKERYAEAIRFLRQNAAIVSKYNVGNLSHAYSQLAQAFDKISRPDSAIYYARMAYQLAIRTNYLVVAKESSLLLSKLFRKTHRSDSAFKYIDLYMKHREESDRVNNESQFSDLRVRIETLEKDHEIETLQASAELASLKNQRLYLALTSAILLGLFTTGFLVARHRMATRKHQLDQLQLRAELEQNKGLLYKQTLNMIHINNSLDSIQESAKDMLASQFDVRIARLANQIKTNKSLENDWKKFNDYFSNVHASFYGKLTELNPGLTNHEKRVCALIKLNLTNREIATLLNIEPRSVVVMKYRVKKKLNMTEADDLESAIQKI